MCAPLRLNMLGLDAWNPCFVRAQCFGVGVQPTRRAGCLRRRRAPRSGGATANASVAVLHRCGIRVRRAAVLSTAVQVAVGTAHAVVQSATTIPTDVGLAGRITTVTRRRRRTRSVPSTAGIAGVRAVSALRLPMRHQMSNRWAARGSVCARMSSPRPRPLRPSSRRRGSDHC